MNADRWTLNPRPTDRLRRLRCRMTGHEWTLNKRGTQAVCYRCWTVDEDPS